MYKKQVKAALDALRDSLVSLGANPYRIDLPRPAGVMKVGIDDFLVANRRHPKKAFNELEQIPLFLSNGIDGSSLLQKDFAEPVWIVKGLIPEGLTILAGKPKVGKSWLVLSLIYAITSGKAAFGSYPIQEVGEAAYLALEDTERRLKDRLIKIKASDKGIQQAHFFCKWNNFENKGHLALERWLEAHPKCRVVFIDTFAKIRRPPKNNNSYYEDYEAASALKEIADKFHIGIVVVHHLRKQLADDPYDAISGTNGISGSADTNIVLMRDRGIADAIMYITGRDVDEQELAMSFDECLWTILGDASQYIASKTQQEILFLLHEAGEAMTPTEIARETGRKVGGLSKTLRRMLNEGLLIKEGRGKYKPKPPKEKKPKYKG